MIYLITLLKRWLEKKEPPFIDPIDKLVGEEGGELPDYYKI
jgi:hypothetical protein